MKFFIKKAYDGVLYLESVDGLWDITYDQDNGVFYGGLAGDDFTNSDGHVEGDDLEEIVSKMKDTYFLDVEIEDISEMNRRLSGQDIKESTDSESYKVESDFSKPCVKILNKKGDVVASLTTEKDVNDSVEEYSNSGDSDVSYEDWMIAKFKNKNSKSKKTIATRKPCKVKESEEDTYSMVTELYLDSLKVFREDLSKSISSILDGKSLVTGAMNSKFVGIEPFDNNIVDISEAQNMKVKFRSDTGENHDIFLSDMFSKSDGNELV